MILFRLIKSVIIKLQLKQMSLRTPKNPKQSKQNNRPFLSITFDDQNPVKNSQNPYIPKRRQSRLNIKIGKYNLPKDFFSLKSFSKPQTTRKRISTHRQELMHEDENLTPKFKESSNGTSFFKSARALNEHQNNYVSSPSTVPTDIDLVNIDRPLRELSIQLRKIRQFSSRKFIEESNNPDLMSNQRGKIQIRERADWENPQKLPPLNLIENLRRKKPVSSQD